MLDSRGHIPTKKDSGKVTVTVTEMKDTTSTSSRCSEALNSSDKATGIVASHYGEQDKQEMHEALKAVRQTNRAALGTIQELWRKLVALEMSKSETQ